MRCGLSGVGGGLIGGGGGDDDFGGGDGAAAAATESEGVGQREFVEAEMNTKSFPTINKLTADGKLVKYESEDRTVAAMTEFAKSAVAA